jgi:hypothetical protein
MSNTVEVTNLTSGQALIAIKDGTTTVATAQLDMKQLREIADAVQSIIGPTQSIVGGRAISQ